MSTHTKPCDDHDHCGSHQHQPDDTHHHSHCSGSCDHSHDDEDDENDPAFQQLELEFIAYVRRKLTQEEIKNSTPDQMNAILTEFQDLKREQYRQQAILEKHVQVILERFPSECDAMYRDFFNPQFWIDQLDPVLQSALSQLHTYRDGDELPQGIVQVAQNVYRIPMYRKDFLSRLSDFLVYAQLWVKQNNLSLAPPNSMNRYGVTLEHIGLDECVNMVTEHVIGKLTLAFFPWLLESTKDAGKDSDIDESGGPFFDSNHSFIVRYKSLAGDDASKSLPTNGNDNDNDNNNDNNNDNSDVAKQDSDHKEGEHKEGGPNHVNPNVTDDDRFMMSTLTTPSSSFNTSSLSLHTDASHVTLNLCMGTEFTGGNLYLKGHRCHQHANIELDMDDEDEEKAQQMAEESRKLAEDLSLEQVVGSAYVHLGTLRHGAEPITSGYRENLIIWATTSLLPTNQRPCLVCQLSED